MYTFEPPGLYSEEALRGVCLRSAPNLNKFKLSDSKVLVPLGSFSGGFSSTAGYVPGNEARQFSEEKGERRSTCQADHFLEALSVFILITQVSSLAG
jgi:hypothetical protein